MKKVKEKLQAAGKSADEVVAFEKGAQVAAKKLIANFDNLEFYIGESMNVDAIYIPPPPTPTPLECSASLHCTPPFRVPNIDGVVRVALLNYREDGVTPFLTFWKHGLKEEKV